jgi:hypothetical protein
MFVFSMLPLFSGRNLRISEQVIDMFFFYFSQSFAAFIVEDAVTVF